MASTAAGPAWRSRDVLRVTGLVLGVYLALRLFWVAQEIFFLAFIGLLFGLTLSAAAGWARARVGIPRAVAAPAILLLVLAGIAGLGSIAAPQVSSQLRQVQSQVPQVAAKIRGWVETKAGGVTEMLSDSTSESNPETRKPPAAQLKTPAVKALSPQLGTVGHAFFTVFSSTLAALGGADPRPLHHDLRRDRPRTLSPGPDAPLSAPASRAGGRGAAPRWDSPCDAGLPPSSSR